SSTISYYHLLVKKKMYDPKIHNGGYLKWHYQGMGLQPVHKQTYFNIVAISL
ncbi:hypothetical protein HKBW3S03_00538, partial [Candidatus Hakubella thermalkaliphila]